MQRGVVVWGLLFSVGVAWLPASHASAQDDACVPPCRSGFTCIDGSCVSACNPPCPDGQVCTAEAECVPIAEPTQGAPPPSTPQQAAPATTQTAWGTEPAAQPNQPTQLASAGWVGVPDGGGSQAPPSAEESSTPVLQVNVAGVGMFGPVFAFEIPLSSRLTLAPRVRPWNLGALAYETLADLYSDMTNLDTLSMKVGFGGGLGLRTYFGRARNTGFYLGTAVEAAYTLWSTDEDYDGLGKYERDFLVVAVLADIGVRMSWGKFVLGLGAEGGVHIPSENGPFVIPVGQAVIDVGFRL